ncbi:hypothetical protein BO99DRAFT_96601 [Aspergillus violaceofuscus CBS 115571]|uniref:Uncharacterized protein n=1 Tax=Aspergillus violaceofuscus (strain CBS 115571) TaxID=1450538 RepID=A0A2V5H9N2_ASPV1|nr:hypothetical protein BO99DRAFT_96601 [Aspergillus violaceofuscus CBS 115571]
MHETLRSKWSRGWIGVLLASKAPTNSLRLHSISSGISCTACAVSTGRAHGNSLTDHLDVWRQAMLQSIFALLDLCLIATQHWGSFFTQVTKCFKILYRVVRRL